MFQRKKLQRLKGAFKNVFESESGKIVLAYLWENLHGDQPTWPRNGNPFELARNDGKRVGLLMILEMLDENDMTMKLLLAEERRVEERMREEEL